MACLPPLGSVPAAYAVVAGGCDWPLPPAVGLSNNHVIGLRVLRQLRVVQLRHFSYVPYVSSVTFLTSLTSVPLRSLRCVRCVEWKPRFRLYFNKDIE